MATTWAEFERAEPELAAFGHERLHEQVCFHATLRRDGWPACTRWSRGSRPGCCWCGSARTAPRSTRFATTAAPRCTSPMDNPDGEGGEFLVRGWLEQVAQTHPAVQRYVHDASYELAFYSMSVEEAVGTTYEGRKPRPSTGAGALPGREHPDVASYRPSPPSVSSLAAGSKSNGQSSNGRSVGVPARSSSGDVIAFERGRVGRLDGCPGTAISRPILVSIVLTGISVPPLPLDPASQPADARIEGGGRVEAVGQGSCPRKEFPPCRPGPNAHASIPFPGLNDVRPVEVPDTEVVGASSATQDIVVAADQHVLDLIIAEIRRSADRHPRHLRRRTGSSIDPVARPPTAEITSSPSTPIT